jgi:uncharacterized protein YceK
VNPIARAATLVALAAALAATTSGCATYSTISNAGIGTPKVYSGTRLNVHALAGDASAVRRFPVPPPRHPAADLPLSFLLDTALLPMTVPVATYELVFN